MNAMKHLLSILVRLMNDVDLSHVLRSPETRRHCSHLAIIDFKLYGSLSYVRKSSLLLDYVLVLS
jgi:hypothetical protein